VAINLPCSVPLPTLPDVYEPQICVEKPGRNVLYFTHFYKLMSRGGRGGREVEPTVLPPHPFAFAGFILLLEFFFNHKQQNL